MRTMVWTCDRCRTRVEVDEETIHVEEWSPKAVRRQPREWVFGLDGWEGHADDERVVDVCPGCLTDEERAARVLRHIEADAMFR